MWRRRWQWCPKRKRTLGHLGGHVPGGTAKRRKQSSLPEDLLLAAGLVIGRGEFFAALSTETFSWLNCVTAHVSDTYSYNIILVLAGTPGAVEMAPPTSTMIFCYAETTRRDVKRRLHFEVYLILFWTLYPRLTGEQLAYWFMEGGEPRFYGGTALCGTVYVCKHHIVLVTMNNNNDVIKIMILN